MESQLPIKLGNLINFICSTLHKEVQEAYLKAVQMDTQAIDAELQVCNFGTFTSYQYMQTDIV